MYKVYHVSSRMYYRRDALVAAENVDEANQIIKGFKDGDITNWYDSGGWDFVDESDIVEDLFASRKGIVFNEIAYTG